MSDQHENLLDHNYDGIQEYDNPTPGWWSWMFAASFVFSVFYLLFFHIGSAGWTVEEEHSAALARNVRLLYGDLKLAGDEATLLQYMNEPDWMAVGQAVYVQNCAQCHQKDGSGINGVNMTDDNYKNVRKLSDIPGIVRVGAANGSMPAWGTRLHPNDIVLVSCYVANMRGKNLPGRAAEGDVIAPWPAYTPPAEAEDAAPDVAAPDEAAAAPETPE